MGISRKADYALRVMVELAGADREPISTRALADMVDAPYAFIAKIVGELAVGGFVELLRGRGGGVKLAADPETTTALAVLEAVNGPLTMNKCVYEPQSCPRSEFCALRDAFADAQRRLEEAMSVDLLTLATSQRHKLAAICG